MRRLPRGRIGAAAGGALGGLALLLLLTHGRPARRAERAIGSSAGTPTNPPLGQVIAPAREPEKENPAAKEAAIVKEPSVPTSLSVAEPKEPVVMEPVAKPQATPAATRSPKTERHERITPASTTAATATGTAARDTAERPRARPSPEVRMHNGVPLLD